MTTEHSTSSASVATDRPGRFAKQLVAHLGRRAGGSWDAETGNGFVDFGEAMGRLSLVAEPTTLRLTIQGKPLDKLEDAVGGHLVRFGARNELHVSWARSDGSLGTQQRYTSDDNPASAT